MSVKVSPYVRVELTNHRLD